MFDFIRKPELWRAWDEDLDSEIESTTRFSLKTIQDVVVYRRLREARGSHIAEIGAGHSRLLRTLAQTNTCISVEKFEGLGAGPSGEKKIPGVRNVPAYLGEMSAELEPASLDIVFSISVVEHVLEPDALAAFHEDQLRILKPGGTFIHAIDMYIEAVPAPQHVKRFEAYREWVTSTPSVAPVDHVYDGPFAFTPDLATNPDDMMYSWGRTAPSLIDLRQRAQSVSVLVAGRKL